MLADSQAVPVLVTKTHRGITPPVFNLCNRRRRVVRYIPHPVALIPGEETLGC